MLNAVVIPFPERSALALQASADGPAQIIIFPGVRYMHVAAET